MKYLYFIDYQISINNISKFVDICRYLIIFYITLDLLVLDLSLLFINKFQLGFLNYNQLHIISLAHALKIMSYKLRAKTKIFVWIYTCYQMYDLE